MRLNGGIATAAIILAGIFIFFDVDRGVVHFNENTLLWFRLNGIFLIFSIVIALVASGVADFLVTRCEGAFYSHYIVPICLFVGAVYASMYSCYGPAGPSDIAVWLFLGLLGYWLVRAISALTNDDEQF